MAAPHGIIATGPARANPEWALDIGETHPAGEGPSGAGWLLPPARRDGAGRHAVLLGGVQCLKVVLGMGSTLVLAKLLVPADFGLMAVVTPALALVGMTQDIGLSQVMVQRRDLGECQAASMYWLTFAAGCAGGAGLAVLSPALAWFFGQPAVLPTMLAMSVVPAIQAAYAMHASLLARHMMFARMAAVDLAATVASTVVGIASAWWLRSAWALVWATMAGYLVQLVWYRIACDWSPGKPRIGSLGGVHRFGASLSAANVFNFVHRNADNVIVARAFGPASLGLYDRAFKLLVYPMQQVQAPAARIMIPLLSSLVPQPDAYRRAFMDCSTLLMAAVQPFMLFAALRSDRLVEVLLGPSWVASSGVFTCFALVGVQQVYTSTLSWLLITQGRGRDVVGLAAYGAVTSVASYLFGLRWGLDGVAICYAAVDTFARVPVVVRVVGRAGAVSGADIVACAVPHGISSAVAVAVVWLFPFPGGGLAGLGAGLLASVVAYQATLAAFPQKRSTLARSCSQGFASAAGAAVGITRRLASLVPGTRKAMAQ